MSVKIKKLGMFLIHFFHMTLVKIIVNGDLTLKLRNNRFVQAPALKLWQSPHPLIAYDIEKTS